MLRVTGGIDEPWKWMRSRGAHTYRSTYDISDKPESFIEIFRKQFDKFENSSFDCYNDLDMLTVGMNGKGYVAQMSAAQKKEYLMQFVMWAYFGSPLIIGADVRNIDEDSKNILLNKEIISINQDPETDRRLGVQIIAITGTDFASCLPTMNWRFLRLICILRAIIYFVCIR